MACCCHRAALAFSLCFCYSQAQSRETEGRFPQQVLFGPDSGQPEWLKQFPVFEEWFSGICNKYFISQLHKLISQTLKRFDLKNWTASCATPRNLFSYANAVNKNYLDIINKCSSLTKICTTFMINNN